MDWVKSLRIIALRDVLIEDSDYQLREAFRWYARTYGITPIEAIDLPLEHVLQEYFEDKYAHMSPEDRQQELEEAIESDEEREKRLLKADTAQTGDSDFDKLTMQMIAEQERQAQKGPIAAAAPTAAPIVPMKEVGLEGTGKQIHAKPKVLPGINMKFELPPDMEDLEQK